MSPNDIRGTNDEAYYSVDIEAAGPIPGEYSMLALGACVVGSPQATLYVELQPINERFVPEALKISGLSLEGLRTAGRPPGEAMSAFRDWVVRTTANRKPVFVGFNASFDWSFVNWYFHMFVGENPFGIGALDIKAYYMGFSGCAWTDTASSRIPGAFQPAHRQTHNALDDAIAQAEIFERLVAAQRTPRKIQGDQR